MNKRALGKMYPEGSDNNGKKHPLQNPATKRQFKYIGSKVNTGQKRKSAAVGKEESDGLTAKRKDEMFGRVSPSMLSKFLSGQWD